MDKFGEISWNEESGNGGKNTNSKDLFLRLDEGPNELRLVTQPFQYLVHKIKKDPTNTKDFGQKVSCSAIHGKCPACDTGDKAKTRWLLGVIVRKTGTYKILDVSYAVFSQVKKLANNTKHWGDPTKYDINVIVDPNGGATGYYSVQGIPKEPLSASDQQLKDNADIEDLKRRVTPPTPELVQKRMDKILGTTPAATGNAANTSVKKVAKVDVAAPADEGDLPEFPNYDGSTAA